jgi:ribosome biogenesis GTPase A
LGRKEIPTSRSVSPKVLSDNANLSSTASAIPALPSQQQQPIPRHNFMTERSTKLIDDQQFSENLSEFLSDNQDFFVVGVVGPQGVGKSTLMNALANGLIEPKPAKDEISRSNGSSSISNFFRVQSFEKQMTGEHCTNGASAWISPKHRIILIDSQAANSPSVLDRTIQVLLEWPF